MKRAKKKKKKKKKRKKKERKKVYQIYMDTVNNFYLSLNINILYIKRQKKKKKKKRQKKKEKRFTKSIWTLAVIIQQ